MCVFKGVTDQFGVCISEGYRSVWCVYFRGLQFSLVFVFQGVTVQFGVCISGGYSSVWCVYFRGLQISLVCVFQGATVQFGVCVSGGYSSVWCISGGYSSVWCVFQGATVQFGVFQGATVQFVACVTEGNCVVELWSDDNPVSLNEQLYNARLVDTYLPKNVEPGEYTAVWSQVNTWLCGAR